MLITLSYIVVVSSAPTGGRVVNAHAVLCDRELVKLRVQLGEVGY